MLTGSCHCGNIEYVFSTQKHIGSFIPSKCDCDFCKKHSAEYISDPDGEVEISVREDIIPIKYVFNLKTAEYLSCPTCGTFVCATIKNQGKFFSVTNIRTLDFEFQKLLGNKNETCWDGESREQRKERRFKTWTPTIFKSKTMLEHMKVNTEEGLQEFINMFENRTLPKNKWTHEAHFVVSFWYSYHYDSPLELVRRYISEYNLATGVENSDTDGYHETITHAYLRATKEFIDNHSGLGKIEILQQLLASEIVEKNYLLKFYSSQDLMSVSARKSILEPQKELNQYQEIVPGFFARTEHGKQMTVVYWSVQKGSILPAHSHAHEQVSNFIDGEFELTVNGVTKIMQAGDLKIIKSNETHSGRAISDCKIIDVFYPSRHEGLVGV
jgi:quercetin dioxygenase-like cupin family protein